MDNNELMVQQDAPMSPQEVLNQISQVEAIMKAAMRVDEHYGVIPGCKKPSLLKPGAEKLCLTFRLDPQSEVEITELGGGHRDYLVKTTIFAIRSGARLGSGKGSASTMETKWRYRTGPVEYTDMPVPKDYWNLRKTDPKKAAELLGHGYVAKKNDNGIWVLAIQGDKVEHDNPADYYNTCLKMASKRSLVDAVLKVTAASDIFTQDIEEEKNEPVKVAQNIEEVKSVIEPLAQKMGEIPEEYVSNKNATQKTINLIRHLIRQNHYPPALENGFCESKGCLSLGGLSQKDASELITLIEEYGKAEKI